MATHTPGPITVERVNNEHSSRAGDGRTHPRVNGWRCSMAEYERAPEEHEANATLYAASPDLLAACEDLLAVVAIQNGNLHADTNEIQAKARAAIAKARGTTHWTTTCSACGRPGHGADEAACRARGTT
jgi:hypothetical protein